MSLQTQEVKGCGFESSIVCDKYFEIPNGGFLHRRNQSDQAELKAQF